MNPEDDRAPDGLDEADGVAPEAGADVGFTEVAPVDPSGADALASRRQVIKRAAAGAAFAGAAWMAPKVEGLSLLPDYASAATLTGTVSTTHDFFWLPEYDGPGGNYYTDDGTDKTGTDYWGLSQHPGPLSPIEATPVDTLGSIVTNNQAVPTLPGASVSVSIPQGVTADAGANIPVTVNFPGFDPPFNRITAGNLLVQTRAPDNNTTTYGPFPQPISALPGVTVPAPTSTPISFTLPEALNGQGPSPAGNLQWAQLTFVFSFGPGPA